MNNDLISRSALKDAMWDESHDIVSHTEYGKDEARIGLTYPEIENIIDNAPTVDMNTELSVAYLKGRRQGQSEERPTGEWIDEGQYAEGHSEHAYSCKNCGYHIIAQSSTILENLYCKHCGADMRKGVRKNDSDRL